MADAARTAILPHFRSSGLTTDNKAHGAAFDPVTIADREAEAAMRAILAEHRPEDGILGEEFPDTPSQSGLTWVVDPIDGTRGFMSGTPTWGVLIAVGDQSGPHLGLIDQPYIGERFLGAPGIARWQGPHHRRDLATRKGRTLDQAIIFSTFPEVGTPAEGRAFHHVASRCLMTRYGMDCYAYALLAAGQVDLVVEAGLKPYDIQAPIAVIQAAGGIVTDWEGGPVHNGGRAVAAATPELHQAVLSLLAEAGA